jgi:hypothetical protein
MATPKPTPKPKATVKATPKPSSSAKPKETSPFDAIIKLGVSKLSKQQKDQLARMLGITVDKSPNRITNPNYKGNPKDLNPNWKPPK